MSDQENAVESTALPKIRGNVLELLSKLDKDNEKIVVKNGAQLIRLLVEVRGKEDDTSELQYALRRMVRGLGASSNASKQGFYMVLVGLLNCVDIGVADILEIGDRELGSCGGDSKSEKANAWTGQILLCGAIIRTGLFLKASPEEIKTIVEKLLLASKTRTYLYLLAATFINQLCNNVDENYFKTNLWPTISPELSKPWSEQNVDTLYLLFVLNDRFPGTVNSKYIRTFLGSDEIISTKNLGNLANILINMPRLETANHPIYDLLCKPLSSKKFATTFVAEADKLLISYNYNRHTVFTLILTSIVGNLETISALPRLITKNYLQQTLHYFKRVKGSKNPEQLQRKIYDLFDKIIESLKKENATSEIKVNILKKLLFDPGMFLFEKITRTKMVQRVVATLDQKGLKSVADIFKSMILSEKGDSDGRKHMFLNNDKVYATQLLVKMLGHESMKEKFSWKIEQMKFLMEVGFVKSEKYSHIGNELSGCIRESFYKALMTKQQSFNNVRIMLWKLSQHLNPYMEKSSLRCTLEDNTKPCWDTAYKMFETIEKKEPNQLNHVYQTLFLFLAFHVFKDANLTKESLSELQSCYERINATDDNFSSDDLHFSEVMVDMFLCLLSYNSSLIRNLVNRVFPHFTKHLTDTAFSQILYVLDPENKNILGRNSMNGNEDEDTDASYDEDMEIMKELNGGGSEMDEDDSETDDESEGSMSEIENTNELVNQNLKEAVHLALGQFGDEEIDLDEMSETEGQKLDEALALAFKKNVTRKPKKQSHKENLKMNFRIRVIDLIDLYFENEPSMMNCVKSLPILLKLQEYMIREPFQNQLLDRITRSVKKLSALKEFGSIEALLQKNQINEFISLYLSLLEHGEKNVFIVQAMKDSHYNSCIFFIRCAQYLRNSNRLSAENKLHLTKSIESITTIALDSYFLFRDPLIPFEMFRYIIQTNYFGLYDLICSALAFVYLEDLKLFKKIHALNLAKDFFKNHRFLVSNAATSEFVGSLKTFLETTRNIFQYTAKNNSALQEKFLQSLLKLLLTIKESPFKISYGNLMNYIEKYNEICPFGNVTKACYRKLCGKVKGNDNDGESVPTKDDEPPKSVAKRSKKTLKDLKSRIEREKSRLTFDEDTKRIDNGKANAKKRKNEIVLENSQEIHKIRRSNTEQEFVNGAATVHKNKTKSGQVGNKNKRNSLNVKDESKNNSLQVKMFKGKRRSSAF